MGLQIEANVQSNESDKAPPKTVIDGKSASSSQDAEKDLAASAGEAKPETSQPNDVDDKPLPKEKSDANGVHGNSHATLWCHVRGRSHASLMEWGVLKCKDCSQDLRLLRNAESNEKPETASASWPADSIPVPYTGCRCDECMASMVKRLLKDPDPTKDATHKPDPSEAAAAAKAKSSGIAYALKFLDEGGYLAAFQPWEGPFDLDRERRDIVDTRKPIVEMVTVVKTTIKVDRYRTASERSRLLEQGILRNPKYAMWVEQEEIVIRSEPIMRALKKVTRYYPGARLAGDSMTVQEPYAFLFHHLDALVEFRGSYRPGSGDGAGAEKQLPTPANSDVGDPATCDEETHKHLSLLQEIFTSRSGEAVAQETARWRRSPAVATFDMLWLLLKPGADVYTKIDGGLAGCVLKSAEFRKGNSTRVPDSYRVEMWYLDFDGNQIGRREHVKSITAFDGEREITDLEVFPCEYQDNLDKGVLRKQLEDRGEKYMAFINGKQVKYRGWSLGLQMRYYEDRVIIDPSSYYNFGDGKFSRPEVGMIDDSIRFHRSGSNDGDDDNNNKDATIDSSVKSESPWKHYDDIDPKIDSLNLDVDHETGKKNRHRYFLLPKRVIGFVLKSRAWAQLNIECCEQIKFSQNAIENLVMPQDRIDLISALVYRYTNPDAIKGSTPAPWTADFIENKGEGQIFLLHGLPGVGKTYTAECVAESTGRPLLSLTSSDIGVKETVAEENLSKWFRLAEIWGAILLLDEADVFLEKRVTADLKRNSLVSVFLRAMEYYRGILFLTTNRVGNFDDAFVSRIHVVIRYDKLSEEDRDRIWMQFLDKLEDERGKTLEIPRATRRYVQDDPSVRKVPWNGREIRNVVQTAVALAEHRFAKDPNKNPSGKAVLKREDFQKVCEMAGAFRKYLDSFGETVSQRAYGEGARNDGFTENEAKGQTTG